MAWFSGSSEKRLSLSGIAYYLKTGPVNNILDNWPLFEYQNFKAGACRLKPELAGLSLKLIFQTNLARKNILAS